MVVIGSSFISMELVAAVSKRKLASIDVIGMEEYPFEIVLGKEVGKGLKQVCSDLTVCAHNPYLFTQYHEAQGVKFHMSSKVEKIVAQEGNSALAGGVIVNGQTIPADFVIMGVGVAPATEFLKGSGIELERDGGVKVDEYLRVKGQKGVYAIGELWLCEYIILRIGRLSGLLLWWIGDIAVYPTKNGEFTRIEHWNVSFVSCWLRGASS